MNFEEAKRDSEHYLKALVDKFFNEYPEKKILYDQGLLIGDDPRLTPELIPDPNTLNASRLIHKHQGLLNLIFKTYPEENQTRGRKMGAVLKAHQERKKNSSTNQK